MTSETHELSVIFFFQERHQKKKYFCNICVNTTLLKRACSTCQTEIAKKCLFPVEFSVDYGVFNNKNFSSIKVKPCSDPDSGPGMDKVMRIRIPQKRRCRILIFVVSSFTTKVSRGCLTRWIWLLRTCFVSSTVINKLFYIIKLKVIRAPKKFKNQPRPPLVRPSSVI